MAEKKIMTPVHPGELLREEFLSPMGITPYRLAKDIGVPAQRIHELVHERRGVSADTALRLSRYFGMSEGYWMNAQKHYELEIEKDRLGAELEDIRLLSAAGKENSSRPTTFAGRYPEDPSLWPASTEPRGPECPETALQETSHKKGSRTTSEISNRGPVRDADLLQPYCNRTGPNVPR